MKCNFCGGPHFSAHCLDKPKETVTVEKARLRNVLVDLVTTYQDTEVENLDQALGMPMAAAGALLKDILK